MTILCVTCAVLRRLRPDQRPRVPTIPQCCDGCRDKLSTDLAAIPEAYAAVPDSIEPIRAGSERHSKGYESQAPLNVAALSLLGHGSVIPATEGSKCPQDQLGTVPPVEQLAWWVEDWISVRGNREPMPSRTIYSVSEWLLIRLGWACDQHPAIDEFATDVQATARSLRAFVGRDQGEKVGNCPRKDAEQRCNTPLYVDPYVDEIQCSRCRTQWKRRAGEWMHLKAQQIAAGVEAA